MSDPQWTAERRRDYQRLYRQRDPEKWTEYMRDYMRRYRAEHAQELLEKRRRRYRDVELAAGRRLWQELRQRVLELFGGVCNRCGFSDARALQVDHINGGGRQELRGLRNTGYYRKILACGGVGYQLLCANCNWIKRYEEDEHGRLPS